MSRARCLCCSVSGRFPHLVHVIPSLGIMLSIYSSSDFSFPLFFLVVSTRLKLKSCYQGKVQATLDFALTIDDFDELADSLSLYDHFLGPKPSAYILCLILSEERSKYLSLIFSLFFVLVYTFV